MAFNIESTIYKYLEVAKDVIQRDKLDAGLWYSNISSIELPQREDRDSLVIKSASMKNTSGALKDDGTDFNVNELLALNGFSLTFDVDTTNGIINLKNGNNTYYDITTLINRTTNDTFTPASHNNKYLDYYTRYVILNNYLKNTKTPISSDTYSGNFDIARFNTFITAPNITKKSKYEHLIKCLKEYYHMGLLFYNYKYIDNIYRLLCEHNIFDELDNLIEITIKALAISYGKSPTLVIKNQLVKLIKLGYTAVGNKNKGFEFKYYTRNDEDNYRSDSEYLIVSTNKELIKIAYENIKNIYTNTNTNTNTNTVYTVRNFITGNDYTKSVSSDFIHKINLLITELTIVDTALNEIEGKIQSALIGKLHNYKNYIKNIKLYFTNLKTIFTTTTYTLPDVETLEENKIVGTITGDIFISPQEDDNNKDYSVESEEYIIGYNIENIVYNELRHGLLESSTDITFVVTIKHEAQEGHITTENTYNYLTIQGTDSFNTSINIDLSDITNQDLTAKVHQIIYIREYTTLIFDVTRNNITDTFHVIDKNNNSVSLNANGNRYTIQTPAKGTYKVYTIKTAVAPIDGSDDGSDTGLGSSADPADQSFHNNVDISGLTENYFIIEVVSSQEFRDYYKSKFLLTAEEKFNKIFNAFYSFDNNEPVSSSATSDPVYFFGHKNLKNIETIRSAYIATGLNTQDINYILLNAEHLTRSDFAKLNLLISNKELVSDIPELKIQIATDNLLANLNDKCRDNMTLYFENNDFESDKLAITDAFDSLDVSQLKTKLENIVKYYRQLKNINTVKTKFKGAISNLKETNKSITSDSEKKTVTNSIETKKKSIKEFEKKYKESTDKFNTKNAELNNIVKSNLYNNIFLYITIVILIIICLGVIYINNHKASLKTQYAVMVITFLLLYYIIYTNVTISVTEDFISQCSTTDGTFEDLSNDLMDIHTSILSYLTHNIDNDFYDSTNKSLEKEKNKYANYTKSSNSKVNNLELVLNDEFINAIKSKELVKFLILFTAICIVCFIVQTNVEDLTTTSIIFIILFIIILSIYFYNINLMTRTKHDNKYWNHRMTMK